MLQGNASQSVVTHNSEQELPELDARLTKQIEDFFISYNRLEGKKFKVLGQGGPKKARKAVLKAHGQFEKDNKKKRS